MEWWGYYWLGWGWHYRAVVIRAAQGHRRCAKYYRCSNPALPSLWERSQNKIEIDGWTLPLDCKCNLKLISHFLHQFNYMGALQHHFLNCPIFWMEQSLFPAHLDVLISLSHDLCLTNCLCECPLVHFSYKWAGLTKMWCLNWLS